MPEVVRFIDNDKVVVFFLIVAVAIDDFIKTSVSDKAAEFVLDTEVCKSVFPVAFDRWREDDEDAGIVAIGSNETLGNHSGNHSLAQTHHISDKAAAVFHHNVIALHHSVALVGEVVIVVGELWDEVVFDLVAEVVDEHPHI